MVAKYRGQLDGDHANAGKADIAPGCLVLSIGRATVLKPGNNRLFRGLVNPKSKKLSLFSNMEAIKAEMANALSAHAPRCSLMFQRRALTNK
jgi:hypothetical protein